MKDLYDALASAIYLSRLNLAGQAVETDDQRIRASGLYADWSAGAYGVYPDIVPGNAAWFTFWRPLHGTSPETARPFVPVQGSHDMYHAGEYMTLDGVLYRCKQDTNFSPEDYAAAWETV